MDLDQNPGLWLLGAVDEILDDSAVGEPHVSPSIALDVPRVDGGAKRHPCVRGRGFTTGQRYALYSPFIRSLIFRIPP